MSALDKLYLDVFTTALEGGIGYWSTCEKYHWQNDGQPDLTRCRECGEDVTP